METDETLPTSTREPASKRHSIPVRRRPRSPLWRMRAWQVLLLTGFLVICGRLYYLQIIQGEKITQNAADQRQKHNLLVHRGAITDRHGLPLAIDTTRYDLYIHPELIKVGTDEAAETLARITHQEKPAEVAHLKHLLSAGYPVVTIARSLEREAADELQALNWTGVDIVSRPFRQYPEGTLAAHLLGYVNMDTKGQGGIEQAQENSLRDTGKIPKPQLDGHGHTIMLPKAQPMWDITPPLGRHIELTIDNYLQHLAERELTAMCEHSRAQRGTAIIEDPTTGEILAWANFPTYDPNQYSKYPFSITKNWAMVDVYQPGSTFKILTVSSGLDTGAIKPNWSMYDSGTLNIGNRSVHNHDGGHGQIDLLHLLIHSSNVGAASVALRTGAQGFHDKLAEFSIGHQTGIDLPGESAGLLLPAKDWKPLDTACTGFGQGAMACTPLQLISAVSAVANDGLWIQPHLIKRVYDPTTGVTEKWTEPKKREVLQKSTAKLVSSLLATNIATGSQIAGQVPGYRVAGKTGTAQKVTSNGRGYMAGQTIASFIGFLPAENPQLTCIVVVDGPLTDGQWGNTVAGPVFNAIALQAAQHLGIPTNNGTAAPDGKPVKKMAPVVPPSVRYSADLESARHKPAAKPKTH
jgi:cell division protein FtsI/penicillin-binding protein 2